MGNLILDLQTLNHRSRDRIKDLGEVFTPENYVEEMLQLLGAEKKSIWADEEVSFFEPCCGHGNIVIPIFKKRLEAIHKKASSQGNKAATYYSIANALNTLWAIDLDSKNIENCKSRVLDTILKFLKEKEGPKAYEQLFLKKKDFFAHILSAINWHISENETLSCLSDPILARQNSNKTRSGTAWVKKNGVKKIDFELTWVEFFDLKESEVLPIEYLRAIQFVKNWGAGKDKGYSEFEFARKILLIKKDTKKIEQYLGAA